MIDQKSNYNGLHSSTGRAIFKNYMYDLQIKFRLNDDVSRSKS